MFLFCLLFCYCCCLFCCFCFVCVCFLFCCFVVFCCVLLLFVFVCVFCFLFCFFLFVFIFDFIIMFVLFFFVIIRPAANTAGQQLFFVYDLTILKQKNKTSLFVGLADPDSFARAKGLLTAHTEIRKSLHKSGPKASTQADQSLHSCGPKPPYRQTQSGPKASTNKKKLKSQDTYNIKHNIEHTKQTKQ